MVYGEVTESNQDTLGYRTKSMVLVPINLSPETVGTVSKVKDVGR